ncbi:MAG: GNAT family N-acetyltransferase [Anaerolineaceae bacterium]|nr:GNAT family N-acetyltransferase [Anaerolineaceae bacterium]
MHQLLLNLPTQFETPRLILRAYRPGDGPMYFGVGQRNRAHLSYFERGNAVLQPKNEEEAEVIIRELILEWEARRAFFLGAFERETGEFAGQIYIGACNWDTPEFEVGYFADCAHEAQGYISEALQAALDFIFEHLGAHRVRLECSDRNLRSMHVAERNGFIREAYFKENRKEADGSYSGTLVYGMVGRTSC